MTLPNRALRTFDPALLLAQARSGSVRALGRLLSLIDDRPEVARTLLNQGATRTGRAHQIGVTGAPGVGKSTTTSALITELRSRGLTVAVLAIDPSSPFTGGALLGDRVRMSEHSGDAGVFIRSMSARGHLGGLSRSAPSAVRALDAVGFDVIIVETVGVGQSEVEIAAMADSVIVVMAPGMGDGIQAVKAGIVETADLFVVNKSDRPGAESVMRDLRAAAAQRHGAAHSSEGAGWKIPVLAVTATQQLGLADVADALSEHRAWAEGSGAARSRRTVRAEAEIEALALAAIRAKWRAGELSALAGVVAAVEAGELDVYSAADELGSSL